ncbi:DUF1566 domain-containing protein [Crenothrix polyspora]|uniref:Lcl C-terminal domain-containing protein n=1 Tax=Crenothrix polyspora TaxID=360316 RepID=A0A1R4HA49_9GAMM|nr:DUF1566 domain-containing protein [Crenothrix polyspora]SJM92901.1 conserved exported hypothetical protein [Crenothrix polyspora]
MSKLSQTIILPCMLVMLPLMGNAQTCNPNITATTPTSRFTRYSNGTVLDTYTGLMWKACLEDQQWDAIKRVCKLYRGGGRWREVLQHVQTLNINGGFAKYKDWRIPNIKELFTLIEWQCISPAINLQVFPFGADYNEFWSSSTYTTNGFDGDRAWVINFWRPTVSDHAKDHGRSLWLVRGGQ